MKTIKALMVEPNKTPKTTNLKLSIDAFNKAVSVGIAYDCLARCKKLEKGVYLLYADESNALFFTPILAYDPFVSEEEIEKLGAKKCDFEELLSESDVISIHTPDIPATDNMFNSSNLHLIKDGAVIINTARPNVIDDTAFIKKLSKNRFMAVLDVTRDAPSDKNHPYRKLPNVVLFPHIAGAVSNGCRRMGKFAVEEAERLYNSEALYGKFDLSKLSIRA